MLFSGGTTVSVVGMEQEGRRRLRRHLQFVGHQFDELRVGVVSEQRTHRALMHI